MQSRQPSANAPNNPAAPRPAPLRPRNHLQNALKPEAREERIALVRRFDCCPPSLPHSPSAGRGNRSSLAGPPSLPPYACSCFLDGMPAILLGWVICHKRTTPTFLYIHMPRLVTWHRGLLEELKTASALCDVVHHLASHHRLNYFDSRFFSTV